MAINAAPAAKSDLDNLAWDDWDNVKAICSLENGADCIACEG